MGDVFGPILGPWNIERAVLTTLEEWLPAYLRNLEAKNGLQPKLLGRPPTPESYRGGEDFESIKQEWLPAIRVVANPVGEPERNADSIVQAFQVDVNSVVLSREGDDWEGAARMRAGLFAAATMLLESHGALGELEAQETVLVGSPRVELFDEDRREIAVGVTTWHVYAVILDPNAGPVDIKEVEPEGPYADWPEATSDSITVTGQPVQTPL